MKEGDRTPLTNKMHAAAIIQQSIRSWEESESRRVTGGSTKGAISNATMQSMHATAKMIRIHLAMLV